MFRTKSRALGRMVGKIVLLIIGLSLPLQVVLVIHSSSSIWIWILSCIAHLTISIFTGYVGVKTDPPKRPLEVLDLLLYAVWWVILPPALLYMVLKDLYKDEMLRYGEGD